MKVFIDERELVKNVLKRILDESPNQLYGNSTVAIHDRNREGNSDNPTDVGRGDRTSDEVLRQPSTYDKNGSEFNTGIHIFLKPNQMQIYKYKAFNSTTINSTLDIFGTNPSIATKELRRAIDQLNGGAKRNNTTVHYRTLSDETFRDKVEKSNYQLYTFWEYRFNGRGEYFLLRPNPIISQKPSPYVPPKQKPEQQEIGTSQGQPQQNMNTIQQQQSTI
jgi:hypothetical protein